LYNLSSSGGVVAARRKGRGMAINVQLGDVASPQRLAMLGVREGGDPAKDADRRLMIVHSGWMAGTFGVGGPLSRDTALSFVPNGPGTTPGTVAIQTFKRGNVDVGAVEAIVSSALSSLAGRPEVAAVDHASMALEPRLFPGFDESHLVLVLRARLAAARGVINAISYQVTVLAHPTLVGDVLSLPSTTAP
jgi:hypothetical protein